MNGEFSASDRLQKVSKTWLITGVAGFIGSNLLEALLKLNQRVIGLDNFSTGHRRNLDQVQCSVTANQWSQFRFTEGDIGNLETCRGVCTGADVILHQAALGSVPRSLADPLASHNSNVTGFLNMLASARDANVKRFVYASSSSVYGDHPALPKCENQTGNCLSPYAATKATNELYASVFSRCYGLPTIGLRYFNVFGPRQDPESAYAAVIPKWIAAMLGNEPVHINGDGETSRDFCYVANVVQANLLAALTENPDALNQIYNVAVGERTTLNELFQLLREGLLSRQSCLQDSEAEHGDFRPGDVRHSHANISKARQLLGYEPTHNIKQGLEEALAWYVSNAQRENCATAIV